MAGNVKVEAVTGAAPTAGGNQTFSFSSGFGTPGAAIFIVNTQTTDSATSAAENVLAVGFTDGTNQYACGYQSEDASAKVDASRIQMEDQVIFLQDISGFVDGEAAFSSFGTDQVVINWGNAPAAGYQVTCIAFAGSDLDALVGNFNPNTTQDASVTVATTNVDSDIIFFAGGNLSNMDSSSNTAGISIGACHTVSGGLVNVSNGFTELHNSADGDPFAEVSNTRCLTYVNNTPATAWSGEVTAVDSTGGSEDFTFTTRDGGASVNEDVGFLALRVRAAADTRGDGVWVGAVDSPNSTGSWAVTSPGFTPQFVGLAATGMSAYESPVSNAAGGSFGYGFFDATNEACHGVSSQDNAATTNSRSHYRARALWLRNDADSATAYDGAFSSFDANGWTLSMTTANASTHRWWAFAIEEAAVQTASGNGSLDSGDSTMSGSGDSSSTGNGSLDSGTSTLDASGKAAHEGNGSLVSGDSTLSSSGLVKVSGNGSLDSGDSTLSSEGTSSSSGNGSLDSGTSTLSSEGTSSSSGNGSLVSGDSDFTAEGTVADPAISGNGSLTSQDSTLSAEGISSSSGNGSLDSQVSTLSSEGVSSSTGNGSLASQDSTLAGEGTPKDLGNGNLQSQDSSLSASGEVTDTAIGSGNLQAQTSTLASEGTSSSTGNGNLDSQNSTLTSEGTSSSSGNGALSSQDSTLDSSGLVSTPGADLFGNGNLASAASAISASGDNISAGDGSLVTNASTLSGEGLSSSIGNGALNAQTSTLAGEGTVQHTGEGSLSSNVVSLSASGVVSSVGNGNLAAQDLTLSGSADSGAPPEVIGRIPYSTRRKRPRARAA